MRCCDALYRTSYIGQGFVTFDCFFGCIATNVCQNKCFPPVSGHLHSGLSMRLTSRFPVWFASEIRLGCPSPRERVARSTGPEHEEIPGGSPALGAAGESLAFAIIRRFPGGLPTSLRCGVPANSTRAQQEKPWQERSRAQLASGRPDRLPKYPYHPTDPAPTEKKHHD